MPPDGDLILVVDDTEPARYAKARILRQAGFTIAEAGTGTDALRVVRERDPRLVVLDVNLPDLDGWEVCRRIKGSAETASVVVLQMSATYVTESDTVRALDGGADGCLTEPVEPAVLIATVRALLRAREAEEAAREALAREQTARSAADDARAIAEAANRSKDEFLATVSHELRSPLGAILTWVSLLRAGRLDAERTSQALESIERNTRLQVKLIEDLLDVSRIISGKMRLERGPVDLASVVEAALDQMRPAAEAKSIHLTSHVAAPIGAISGDGARLQQVVSNLLSNAVKFTPKGGTVAVRVTTADSNAVVTVQDTGRGVEPALLPHMFERFWQADSSSTRREGGLGLGLAIVHHIVELHGGTIEVTSPGLGKGLTVAVRVPVDAIAFTRRTGALSQRTGEGDLPRLHGVRVLVIDDAHDARESITSVLEDCGATVDAFGTVREALDSFATDTPHVIVSDIAMPDQDGYDLVSGVRAFGGPAAKVPILALTAYAGPDDHRRVLDAGFSEHVAKPVDPADLVRRIARFVR